MFRFACNVIGMPSCTFSARGVSVDEVLRLAYVHHKAKHDKTMPDMQEHLVKEELREGLEPETEDDNGGDAEGESGSGVDTGTGKRTT